MSKRAARYIRQSKEHTEGIDRQRERTAALVTARGWIDAGVYEDNDISASKARGAGTSWARMLADADAGLIDVVVGVDLDRLLRSTKDLNTLIDHKLQVVTVDGEIDLSSADGEFRATMLAGIARFEVRRKGERQARANATRADAGKPPSGMRLFGYTAVNSEPIPAEAKVVSELFNQFALGESLKGLARNLDAAGIEPRRGGQWTASSIRTMLKNPRYAGRAIYMGRETGGLGTWPALVDEATFDAVQARFADPRRATNRVGTERRHLGSGLYLCGECGKAMTSNSARYWCPGHLVRTAGPIDELVLAVITARLGRPDLAELLAIDSGADVADLDEELKMLRARLVQVQEDYDEGLTDARRYRVATDKLGARIETAGRTRRKLLPTRGGVLDAADPAAAFVHASLAIKRELIDQLATVTLFRAPRGTRVFNPESVVIEWRKA